MSQANLVLDLIVHRVDLVDEGANTAAFIKMYKRKEQDAIMPIEEVLAKMAPEHRTVIEEAIAKAKAEIPAETAATLETAQKAAKEADDKFTAAFDENQTLKRKVEEMENVAKGKPVVDFEEVIKGLPVEQQEFMRTMKSQKDVAEEAVRKAKELEAETVAKSKAAEMANLPVPQEKLVPILKGASAELIDVLKSVNEAIKDGKLFEEVGKRGGEEVSGDAKAAWAKIEKMAIEISKNEGITKEKATGEVMKRHPDLYNEYLNGGAN